ncbi:unnamed protein product [Polarella glacialis]|uniref:Major basic nuclear protein n=1 Tax=Polarella glacialis TaxID=89957 RepID=A0A813FFT0_POLGL|nr:unnamed protein product [Polarella glacialis]
MASRKAAARAMKAGKPGKMAMMKGGLVETLASETELKKSECSKIVDAITTVGAGSVKSTGKFVLPGLCVSRIRQRAAAKAGARNMFGKTPLGLTGQLFVGRGDSSDGRRRRSADEPPDGEVLLDMGNIGIVSSEASPSHATGDLATVTARPGATAHPWHGHHGQHFGLPSCDPPTFRAFVG